MADGFVIRRGGTGLSKCSVIVFAETGSTVAAYSDAACTTKVKDAKEIGTGGSYYITGLAAGTYYIKATKGAKTRKSPAVTFAAEGIQTVTLLYEYVIFRDGILNSDMGSLKKIYGNGEEHTWTLTGGYLTADNVTAVGASATVFGGFDAPVDISGFSTLHVRAKAVEYYLDVDTSRIGLALTNTQSYDDVLTPFVTPVFQDSFAEYTIDLSGFTGTDYYIIVFQNLKASYNHTGGMTTTISEMWLE